jgi:translation initiation factor IF-2
MEKNKENKNLITRPPVVVVMGHIDHGKSSLLCAIKDFKITEKESGGITQHINAYEVEHEGKKITFIDTPGHEAFSAMRSRGAKVADICVLVIDAEEGVKIQTKEVIAHIKKCSLPVIVALNKIDKPQADPERVKRELVQNDIIVESQGGKIPSIEVSAKTKKGIPELLDLILLVGEMEDLRVDSFNSPEGVIIESYLDNKRGPTAVLLLKEGELKTGDIIATDSTFGKVKILEDFQGKTINKVLSSMPAIILGFEKAPMVGETFKKFANLEEAQKNTKTEVRESFGRNFITESSDKKILNFILKADVSGSLEVIEEILKNIPQEQVEIKILKSGIGEITEEDLKTAQLFKAKILGFKVKANNQIFKVAQFNKVKIITFDIIYNLVEAVKEMIGRELKPQEEFKEIGQAKVSAVFINDKNRQIIGAKVLKGEVAKGAKIEVLRNGEVVGQGKLINLQRNKKPIDKIQKGNDCGILFEGDAKTKEGDTLVFKIYG